MATITALMTTYNASQWVEASIASVLSQTFTDFELLIIDDGSTDDTVRIVKTFNDERIKLICNPSNKGVGACLAQALKIVDTPYIAKVDADDISVPERFECQLQFLRKHNLDIVKCFLSYFADSESVKQSERFVQFKTVKEGLINDIVAPKDIVDNLVRWPCFPHTTYFAKLEPLKQVGYPKLRMFEDYVLFLRLINRGYKFGCVEKTLVNMRISDTSTTASLTEHDFDKGLSSVVDEKWLRLSSCLINKRVFVFGTGNMGRSFTRIMAAKGIIVEGFVEKKVKSKELNIGTSTLSIVSLEEFLMTSNACLVIAAQPIREEITQVLERKNKREGCDFFILA